MYKIHIYVSTYIFFQRFLKSLSKHNRWIRKGQRTQQLRATAWDALKCAFLKSDDNH